MFLNMAVILQIPDANRYLQAGNDEFLQHLGVYYYTQYITPVFEKKIKNNFFLEEDSFSVQSSLNQRTIEPEEVVCNLRQTDRFFQSEKSILLLCSILCLLELQLLYSTIIEGFLPSMYTLVSTPLTGSNQVFQIVSILHSSDLLLVRVWPFK